MAAQLGLYCSLCERRLTDDGALWDGSAQRYYGRRAPTVDARDLLLLCRHCSPFSRVEQPGELAGELALPHRHTSLRLDGSGLFSYRLQPVLLTGGEEDETHDLAIVSGTTPAAQATIERFRLNGAGFDAERQRMVVGPNGVDPRVVWRTRSWQNAEKALHTIHSLIDSRVDVAAMLGLAMMWNGNFGVWVTVAKNHVPELEVRRELFAPLVQQWFPGTSAAFLQ